MTFALTPLMDKVLRDRFVTVYIAAETMTQGGKVKSNVQRLRLRRDMFTRTSSYGYYTYKYTSMNGIGNSERLFIWSDDLICLRNPIVCRVKGKTSDRTSPALTSVDFKYDEEY